MMSTPCSSSALIGEASSGGEALDLFREHQPDVTLMDLRLSDMSGIDAMIAIRGEFPKAHIVMLTMIEGDVEIQQASRSMVGSGRRCRDDAGSGASS